MTWLINPYRFGGVLSTTWNPLDKATQIVLSNGNLTASNTNLSARGVRAIASASSGKKYYEVTVDVTTAAGRCHIGIATVTAGLASHVGIDAQGWGWQPTQATPARWTNNVSNAYGAQCNLADVIGILLDIDAGTLEWSKNGTGQGAAFSGLSGTFYPMISIFGQADGHALTARFASASWLTTPAGYTEW